MLGCYWSVEAPEDYSIGVTFNTFDTDNAKFPMCPFSNVHFFDGIVEKEESPPEGATDLGR